MWRIICILVLSGLAASLAVAGESSSVVRAAASAGVGRGAVAYDSGNMFLPETSWLVSGGIWWSDYVVSARYARVGIDAGIAELAVVWERVMVRGEWLVSVGLGPGLIGRRYGNVTDGPDDESFSRLGVAWQAGVQSGARRSAGIGLVAFGSVAGSRSCGGLAVVGRLGNVGLR